MCGRFVPPDIAAMEAHFGLDFNFGDWFRRFNTAPTAYIPMIFAAAGGKDESRTAALARWGLIPPWWKDDKPPTLTFNARSEEAASKPMWRSSLKSHRCLIPALGWYEWRKAEQVRGPSGRKVGQPYFIHAAGSKGSEPFAFAGLWSAWTAPDGSELLSCTILTTAAAPSVAELHDRMPVVLGAEKYGAWLSGKAAAGEVAEMIAGARTDFEFHRVGLEIGNVKNESPELVKEVPAGGVGAEGEAEGEAEGKPKPAKRAAKRASRKPAGEGENPA